MAARTPARIESLPSDGPTVRSSRYLMPAGSAPERRIIDRSFACCWFMLPPLISTGIADGFFDVRNFLNFAVEHHGQALAHVRRSEVVEALPALAGQLESARRAGRSGRCWVAHRADLFLVRRKRAIPDTTPARPHAAPGAACPGSRIASGGRTAAFILQRCLLARITAHPEPA